MTDRIPTTDERRRDRREVRADLWRRNANAKASSETEGLSKGTRKAEKRGAQKQNVARVVMDVHKKMCVRGLNDVRMITPDQVREMIIASEMYFAYNGRVLKREQVNGLKRNVIVHAMTKMRGGAKKKDALIHKRKKGKSDCGAEMSSSETDNVVMEIVG